MIDELLTTTFLFAVLRSAAPVLLATMGSVVTERSGTTNIGVEGMMLGGAFAAVVTTIQTGSVWLGLIAGAATGVLLAAIMAVAVVDLGADGIIAGFAINLFAGGFTVVLMSQLFGSKGSVSEPGMPLLPTIRLPGVDLPLVGAFASLNLMVWLALVSVPAMYVFIFRTRVGLRLRAVGENSDASRAAGVPVRRMRYLSLCIGGLMAGLGGVALSIGYLSSFTRDMTAGRGFIALAAALFGRKHPVGAAAAALLFGVAEAAGNRLQGRGIPSEFVLMIPYVVTVLALAFVSIRSTRRARRLMVTVTER